MFGDADMGDFPASLLALLLVLICSLPQLYMLLVEVTSIRRPLRSRCIIMAGVGIFAFLLKLLSIAAWAVLH